MTSITGRGILRLLLDHGVPAPLRRFLNHHDVTLARDLGWAEYVNGRLIAAAEEAGFDTMVTCDKNIGYQQNLASRRLGLAVLPTNIWPDLQAHIDAIVTFIDGVGQGGYRVLDLPRPRLVRRPAPSRDS